MHYRLNKYCKLVEGAVRGAIYDFSSGKVHSINGDAVKLLNFCQQNELEKVIAAEAENKRGLDFLDQLTAMGLGACYFTESICEVPPNIAADVKLDFLWLELTSNCNNRCLHCYADSGPAVSTELVLPERWLTLIKEARQQGAKAIQLIGGEPLLYPLWKELVKEAHRAGYEFIEIFTNATLIDDEIVRFCKEYNVSIATTVYADNAAVHDAVTLHPGSFEKTMTSIKKLLAEEIPVRIASIIMKVNEDQVQNIMNLCADLGVEVNPPDVVRPTGRGSDKDLKPEFYTKPSIKPPFFTDEESFVRAQCYHSCLAGRLAITADGNVIPCIFARNQVCGNIVETSLAEIINGEALQQCWKTTKDQIEKCKACEYRYACTDCRPLAQGNHSEKNWLACPAECKYNPYNGKWDK